MKWWQAEIHTSQEAADSVIESLLELGAAGVATEDPSDLKMAYEDSNETTFFDASYLKDLPDYVRIKAYYPSEDGQVRYGYRLPDDERLATADVIRLYDARAYQALSTEAFTNLLRDELNRIGQFLDVNPAHVSGEFIDEEDWANEWRQHYHAVKISDRLVIKPTWENYDAATGEKVIELDPGSAFGTGTHESTRLSLQELDYFMVDGAKVLDLGTGSGILAVAAALLGARHVDACDIDSHSVDVAKANILQNGQEDIVNAFVGELSDTTGPYDIIVANLLADLHIKLAPQIAAKLGDLGLYLAGGIILDRKDEVIQAFKANGLGLHQEKDMNDWQLLTFHKDVVEVEMDFDADDL